jgi:hypothetical protein
VISASPLSSEVIVTSRFCTERGCDPARDLHCERLFEEEGVVARCRAKRGDMEVGFLGRSLIFELIAAWGSLDRADQLGS